MSPKSRGRPKGRGRPRQSRRQAPGQLPPSGLLIAEATRLVSATDPVDAERLASYWLGQAWAEAPISLRDPEHQLCLQVCGTASSQPSPRALAAVAALLRVAPESEQPLLRETLDRLAEHQPLPPWHDAPAPEPTAAWRAVDVWDSERALLVEFAGLPAPYTLLARITTIAGTLVTNLALLRPGVQDQWPTLHAPDDPPMPLTEVSPADALAELASALRITDITWPRQDDEDLVELKALAWSRCHANLAPFGPPENLDDAYRAEALEAFRALPDVQALDADPESIEYLVRLFLDYGEGYITAGHLAWSPGQVERFLADWLPRKATLDAGDRRALPDLLRAWVRFALHRRGVDEEWITPVVQAVDDSLPAFTEAFDDTSSWGPAKHLVTYLEQMGVDLSDREAVEDGIRAVNAHTLAQRLLDE